VTPTGLAPAALPEASHATLDAGPSGAATREAAREAMSEACPCRARAAAVMAPPAAGV
jgi:hypothetical protein